MVEVKQAVFKGDVNVLYSVVEQRSKRIDSSSTSLLWAIICDKQVQKWECLISYLVRRNERG